MNKKPFIGITDFICASEVLAMLSVLQDHQKEYWTRRLAVGVMSSWKTLNGHKSMWSNIFPPKESLASIFSASSDPDLFNVLHYADYDRHPILATLEHVVPFCGPFLHGIQLDMIWPDADEVKRFREKHPDIQIIIQGNTNALNEISNDPHNLVRRLKTYGDSIDYILLDKSMGRGKGMDALALLPFAEAISEKLPDLGLVVAGGLGPDTLHLADPIVERFLQVSIDAEGRLRPSGSALDPIDWSMAASYIKKAAQRFDNLIRLNLTS